TGPVIGAVERDDSRAPGREQRGSKRDLDRVLARHAELRPPRQTRPKLRGHLRVREIAERVRDRSRGDRVHHARIAMAERGDADAAGEVDAPPPVLAPDARALCPRPDHPPLRKPGTKRPNVSAAM